MIRWSRRGLLKGGMIAMAGQAGGVMPAVAAPAPADEAATIGDHDVIWFDAPAGSWNDAVPIGNGRIGGMVRGGVKQEIVSLNDDTLWSGQPSNPDNPGALAVLPQVREAVFAGEYVRADGLCKKMQGPFSNAYEPLGDLILDIAGGGAVGEYRRALDLDSAVASVGYTQGGVGYRREMFVSHPDQVMMIRLSAGRPGSLSCRVGLKTPLQGDGGRDRFARRADRQGADRVAAAISQRTRPGDLRPGARQGHGVRRDRRRRGDRRYRRRAG